MRVWFLKQTNSIDTESSVGANTIVWSREGVIYRITPRRNNEVNDDWMADSGRLLYKQVRAADRLTAIKVNGAAMTRDEAFAAAGKLLKDATGAVAIVASGRSSLEEQFVTKKLAAAVGATTHLVSHVTEGDRILISADRTPNVRGALVTGLTTALPSKTLSALATAIDAGKVKVVLCLGEDLLAAGLSTAQLAKVAVIYLGTHENPTSAVARVAFGALTVFEKSGTFINQQFRIQKFLRAVPGAVGAIDDLAVLTALVAEAGAPTLPGDVPALWKFIAAEVPALGTMTFANLPETGLLLDATAWSGLPFVEGETLHFKGSTLTATPDAGKPSTPVAS